MKHMEIKASFLAAYDEHADAIFRFCVARTGNPELAHDLTQDTFMRFWDTLRKKGEVEYTRALIYQIARNAIIDWYRKHKSESLDTMQEAGFDPPDLATLSSELAAEHSLALSTLDKLSDSYREVLVLRYVEGLKPQEIAAVLDETTNVVSVRLTRAMKELQTILHTQDHD